MADSFYLDHNATAPLCPAAREAIAGVLDTVGNPSSVHRQGRQARRLIEDARERVLIALRLPHLGLDRPRLVFTSGATEANHLALNGVAGHGAVLTSAIEHPSVIAARPDAERIPVDPFGVVRLDWLQDRLAGGPEVGLVSVMAVNNETGVIQPIDQVRDLAHAAGALIHVDAVQAVGRLDRGWTGFDLVSLSGHKLGGPAGIGALIFDAALDLAPTIRGGGQEGRSRAGTENLIGIVGMAAAVDMAARGIAAYQNIAALRDAMEAAALAAAPDTAIFGRDAATGRVANTSCLALPGVPAETQVMAFDLARVAISAGAACSSGKLEPSAVLTQMAVPDDLARSAIRVSLGPGTPSAAVDRFAEIWQSQAARRRAAA